MCLGNGKQKGRTAKVVLRLFLIVCVCLALWAAIGTQALPGVFLAEDPGGATEILLFEGRSELVWLADGSGRLLKLDAGTGEVLGNAASDAPLYWAALRGDCLAALSASSSGAELILWNADTLEELSRRKLAVDPGKIVFFDCGRDGAAFAVTDGNRNSLLVLEDPDDSRELNFPEEITFLEGSPAGEMALYAGETLYMAGPGGFPEEPRGVACPVKPLALLGGGKWIDEDGVVCTLAEGQAEALFRCPENVFSSNFYCLDRENCLILSNGGGTVSRYDMEGRPVGSCRLEKAPAALCGSGALYRKEEGLWYAPLAFEKANPSPTPSPSPLPSLAPASEPEAPAWVEGSCLVTHAGTSVSQLRELMKPEEVKVLNAIGKPMTEGGLCTGMTANDWTVVVLGDCDGTGAVSGLDVKQAIEMILEPPQEDTPYFRAADLNGDGRLTSADLAALSVMAFG